MALLGGCTPTPGEVADTGLSGDPPSSTSESSTANPPGSTTEGSATVASADGTGTSGSSDEGPATTMPVDGTGTGTTSEPSTTSGSSEGPGSSTESSGPGTTTGDPADCHPLLAEVLYDPTGGNGGNQWIRLYNPCRDDVELTGYSLGWGGNDYAAQGGDLSGTISAGECFLVGGPTSNASSYDPVFDLVLDFSADLPSSGTDADGVALFADVEASIAADTVPVDAVIYGETNTNALLDAEGDTPAPHVGDAPQGQSIRRTELAPTWDIEPAPTPNDCPAL
jgi:hypothetical protein